MKWIQHYSDAGRDEVLSGLRDRFGTEGYGAWWLIVETIAEQIHDNPRDFAEYSLKKWREITGISTKKLQKLLNFMAEKQKIILENSEKDGIISVKIRVPKILEIADEYTKKRFGKKEKPQKTPDKSPTKSGETPKKNSSDYIRLDKKIEEEKNDAPSLPESKEESEALDRIMHHYNKAYPELPKLAGKQIVAWRGRARDWFHVGMFSGVSEDEIHEHIDKCPVPKHFEILPREVIDEAKKATHQSREASDQIDKLIKKLDGYEEGAVSAEQGRERARSWRERKR